MKPSPETAPVLVVGPPRAGLSMVASLLAQAGGLAFGDTLPPTDPADPPSYVSSAVAHGHNVLLAAHDRDWTCPPPSMAPDDPGAAALRAGIEVLDQLPSPWGVQDPRTLFTLPVWAQELAAVRLVAVVRDHALTVGSIVDHHGMAAYAADDVARAYAMRLRQLVEWFDVPVIDTSQAPDRIVDRVGQLAGTLGLDWDQALALASLDPDRPSARRVGLDDNDDLHRILELGGALQHVPVVTGDELAGAVGDLGPVGERLDRYIGPRAAARRQFVWDAAARHEGLAVEAASTVDVVGAVDPVRPGGAAAPVSDLVGLHNTLLSQPRRPVAILLPDLASWIPADELESALTVLHSAVQLHGVVVVGVSSADQQTRSSRGWPALSATSIATAARGQSFIVRSEEVDDHLVVLTLLPLPTTESVLDAALREQHEARPVGCIEMARDLVRRAVQRLRRARPTQLFASLLRRGRALVRRIASRLGSSE